MIIQRTPRPMTKTLKVSMHCFTYDTVWYCALCYKGRSRREDGASRKKQAFLIISFSLSLCVPIKIIFSISKFGRIKLNRRNLPSPILRQLSAQKRFAAGQHRHRTHFGQQWTVSTTGLGPNEKLFCKPPSSVKCTRKYIDCADGTNCV